MKTNHFPIFLFSLSLSFCSSIERVYYLESYGREPMDKHSCETPCAYQKTESIRLSYWDRSGKYTVARGPCLLPVYPTDTTFQDGQSIHLRIEFTFEPGRTVYAYNDMFNITTNSGESIKHMGLSFYEKGSFYDYVSTYEHSNDMKDKYPVRPKGRIEARYYSIAYGNTKWIEVNPKVEVDGVIQAIPVIRLKPAKDYSYTPYELPFMYMPVR